MRRWWDRLLWGNQIDNWPPGAEPRRIRPLAIVLLIALILVVLFVVKAIVAQFDRSSSMSVQTETAVRLADPQRCLDAPDGSSRRLVAEVDRALGADGPLQHVATDVTPAANGQYQVAMTYHPKRRRSADAATNTALAMLDPERCVFTLGASGVSRAP